MEQTVNSQPTQNTVGTKPSKKNFHISILVVLVLIALVELGLLLMRNGQLPSAVDTENEKVVEESLEEGVQEGVFTLSTNTQEVAVGTPVVLIVSADSNKRGVVGFDTVLQYDPTAFSLASVTSSLPGFTAVGSTRKEYLEVTSAKDPQTTVIPVLEGTEVLRVTLNPLKAGTYPITLIDKIDNSSTKFVDSQTEVYRPQTNSVSVTIK